MIVRPRPHWVHLLFVRRGSLVRRILGQQLFILALSCAVVVAHGQFFHWKIPLTSVPFSLMGIALAIFLGFRINASYERFWEARKQWGVVLVEARNLARKALTQIGPKDEVRPFVLGLAGFAATMRNYLRGWSMETGTQEFLPEPLRGQLPEARFAPSLVLLWLGNWLNERRRGKHLDAILTQSMEKSLDDLSLAFGCCERIASTPLPFTYSVILHRSCYLYCILMPFGLVDSIGWMTPLVVCFISYTFFALEALSDELEEPFGLSANDLALDAIVNTIEANMREMLGEDLPMLPRPNSDFILT